MTISICLNMGDAPDYLKDATKEIILDCVFSFKVTVYPGRGPQVVTQLDLAIIVSIRIEALSLLDRWSWPFNVCHVALLFLTPCNRSSVSPLNGQFKLRILHLGFARELNPA